MKIIWSGTGITDGRGKLGGTLISSNRYGSNAGNFRIPGNPKTVSQQEQRRKFTQVSQEWRQGLSESDREDWIAAALLPDWEVTPPFGPPYQPSGRDLFGRLNLGNFNTVFPLVTPPAYPTLSAPVASDFTVEAGYPCPSMGVTFDGDQIGDTQFLVRGTWSLNQGRWNPPRNCYRNCAIIVSSGASQIVNFELEYSKVFPGTVQGGKVFIELWLMDNVSGVMEYRQTLWATVV